MQTFIKLRSLKRACTAVWRTGNSSASLVQSRKETGVPGTLHAALNRSEGSVGVCAGRTSCDSMAAVLACQWDRASWGTEEISLDTLAPSKKNCTAPGVFVLVCGYKYLLCGRSDKTSGQTSYSSGQLSFSLVYLLVEWDPGDFYFVLGGRVGIK